MCKSYFMHNMLAKIQNFIKVCDLCQIMTIMSLKNRSYHPRVPVDYSLTEMPMVNIKLLRVGQGPAITGEAIQLILRMINCQLKIINPFTHGSMGTGRQTQTICKTKTKHLPGKTKCLTRKVKCGHCLQLAYLMHDYFCITIVIRFSPFELVLFLESH